MANWEQLNFQDGLSPLIEQLSILHDHIIRILILITIVVVYTIFFYFFNRNTSTTNPHNHRLEIIWTLLPALTLFIIAFPSLRLLYMREEHLSSPLSVKRLGHQWYWSYEYSNFKENEFDRFIKREEMAYRLLETDNFLLLPVKNFIQLFTSSRDVLHSWTVPALGVKADSSPGRLNIVNFLDNKTGILYGQCSEICGANHSFIPISLSIVPLKNFINWLTLYTKKLMH